jgi:UDP:flavonoid glycosyltransferase YjiC (YdhE family)
MRLTTGNGIDPASIDAPADVRVVKAAPHSAVLHEAAPAITHGEASYRKAAERIATTITEETATDRAVEEIEAVLADPVWA